MSLPFYTILKKRIIRTPSASLSQRIIMQARYLPQAKKTVWERLDTIFSQEIAISQPLLKFASILILGIMIGLSFLQHVQASAYGSTSIFSFDQDDNLFSNLGDTYE